MIPKETIALIRERTDIVALIGESVRLTRVGRSFKGLCPFHKEKSGSFYVHPDRGFYHCFGCGESGSGIDFLMKQNGLDFREAATMLAERAGIRIEETREALPQRSGPNRDDIYAVNGLAAAFYEGLLGLGQTDESGPRGNAQRGSGHRAAHHAIRELERRGMPKPGEDSEAARSWRDTIQAFRMGYAPPEWDALSLYLKKQGVSAEVAERAGLLVPRSNGSGHYDRFRHRLMFAVADTLGRVVAFTARALDAPAASELGPGAPSYDGEAPAKYINSPESPVYTKGQHLFGLFQAKQTLRSRGNALLVEGNFDVVSLHARGLGHAVAPLGTAFTGEQAKLLKRFAPKVVIAFDGDDAGRKATRSARAAIREGGLEARAIRLPPGADPDDLVRTKGPEALLALESSATGLLEYLISDALDGKDFDGATLEQRMNRTKFVLKMIREEDDPAVHLMVKRFADQHSSRLIINGQAPKDLGELERIVNAELGGGSQGSRPQNRGPAGPGLDPIGQRILGALFDAPRLLGDRDIERALGEVTGDIALSIVALRKHLSDSGQQLAPEVLLASVPRSIHAFAAQRLACPAFETEAEAKTDLLENARKLQDRSSRREDNAVVEELDRASSALTDDTAELLRLQFERAKKKRGLVG